MNPKAPPKKTSQKKNRSKPYLKTKTANIPTTEIPNIPTEMTNIPPTEIPEITQDDLDQVFDYPPPTPSTSPSTKTQNTENTISSTQDFDEILPNLVNRRVIALTRSSLNNNSKSLILGVDIYSKTPWAILTGFQGTNVYHMRITFFELKVLMNPTNFQKIQDMFLAKDPKSDHAGNLKISLYKAKHGGKSIRLQRGDDYNFFFAPVTWRKFGEARDLILMSIDQILQSVKYINQFTDQFVTEIIQALKTKKHYLSYTGAREPWCAGGVTSRLHKIHNTFPYFQARTGHQNDRVR